jgi:WD40 repeat protein
MDKTVRLWHVSRSECLCAFKHSDFVTSISFHPRDDRFFLAGSLDSKLRLWSIPDKSVAFFATLPDLITAVSFTPDGKTAIAGCLSGICLFYETEGLKFLTQLHVRSSHGRNAKGSKITGIQTMTIPPDHPHGETKLLITSNDSRIRLYNFRDKSLEMKFRGNENACSQIHASFSEDTRYVICGSEDRKAFIWSTGPGEGEKKDKRPVEMFEAHKAIVTNAKMAPNKTKQLLSAAGDPVYDLCNPPRVTLISRNDSKASSRQPADSETRDSDAASIPPDTPNTPPPPPSNRPTQSEAWISRSAHCNGNIIITTDYQGQIKVFRQDCAYLKRRNDSWETSSNFSKKMGSGVFSRASTLGAQRQGSFTHRDYSSTNHSSDRILSWRNSIGSSNASIDSNLRNSSIRNGYRPRSTSPRKNGRGAIRNASQTSTPAIKAPDTPSITTASPPQSGHNSPTNGPSVDKLASTFTAASASDPLMIQPNGQSLLFYSAENWRPGVQRGNTNTTIDNNHLAPVDRSMSRVSALSSEEDSSPGERTSEEDGLKCSKCGGRNFKVSGNRVIGKGRRTVCNRCGTEVAG